MTKKFYFFWAFIFYFLPTFSYARTLQVDITDPGMRQIPIAVPYLNPSPATYDYDILGKKISQMISDDLSFLGFFSVLDPALYGGKDNVNWERFNIDFLVKGELSGSGDSITVELKLHEMPSGRFIEGRRYTGKSSDYRQIAHKFSDVVVKAITGDHGVSLSSIVYVGKNGKNKDIVMADFDGFKPSFLTNDKSITISPRLSPDGKFVAYTSFRSGRPYLYIKELKTGKITKIAGYSGINMSPAWHPDGKKLAITLSKDGDPDIYLVDLRGNILSRLTNRRGAQLSPTWSPDGARLAFVSDETGSPQIYVMNLHDKNAKRITYEGAYNTDPQWSPKGDQLIYVGRTGGRFQIHSIHPEGGSSTQLTSLGNNENPSWSPAGRLILFSSDRLGDNSLFYMLSSGQKQRLLVKHRGGATMPHWGPNIH